MIKRFLIVVVAVMVMGCSQSQCNIGEVQDYKMIGQATTGITFFSKGVDHPILMITTNKGVYFVKDLQSIEFNKDLVIPCSCIYRGEQTGW